MTRHHRLGSEGGASSSGASRNASRLARAIFSFLSERRFILRILPALLVPMILYYTLIVNSINLSPRLFLFYGGAKPLESHSNNDTNSSLARTADGEFPSATTPKTIPEEERSSLAGISNLNATITDSGRAFSTTNPSENATTARRPKPKQLSWPTRPQCKGYDMSANANIKTGDVARLTNVRVPNHPSYPNNTLPHMDGMKVVVEQPLEGSPSNANGTAQQSYNDTAFCMIEELRYLHHFPHYMQLILRCSSFYQMQGKGRNVLILPDYLVPGMRLSQQTAFQKGVNDVLAESGVRIVGMSNETASHFGLRGNNCSSVRVYYPGVDKDKETAAEYYVASPNHAREFRRQFVTTLGLARGEDDRGVGGDDDDDAASPRCGEAAMPKIGILNRKKSRTLLNADALSMAIREEFDMEAAPTVAFFEGATFADQVRFFTEHDIVISTHGAQLAGIVFMPGDGALLELFPLAYVIPHYFGSLAMSIGLEYAYTFETLSGDWEGEHRSYKANMGPSRNGYLRGRNVCFSVSKVVDAVKELVRSWRDRCQTL